MRMNKWIVRGFGMIFLLMACSHIFALLTNPHSRIGLLGLSLTLQPVNINVAGWIAAGIYIYTGYNLIRLKESGRHYALFFLWILFILSTLFLIWGIYNAISNNPQNMPTIYYINGERYSIDALIVLFIIGFLDAIFALAIFFLSSNDTKALFHKNLDAVEKADAPGIDGI